jgi:hypothetical protein
MICSGCGLKFQPREKRYHSSVFGCHEDWLCKSCYSFEEEKINEEGNDLPLLKQRYRSTRIQNRSEIVE